MGIAGIMAFFIGVVLMICYPYNKKKNARCSMQTQGTLREIRRRHNSDGPSKSMHVYSYVVGGVEYQLKTTDHSMQVNEIGDVCDIWYNPAKPQDAQAFRGSDKYLKGILIAGIMLTVLGIVLMCVGCTQMILSDV